MMGMHPHYSCKDQEIQRSSAAVTGSWSLRTFRINHYCLVLPGKIYEYITTSAGILLLYNWAFIILSSFKILENKMWSKITAVFGLLLILAAVSGTLLEKRYVQDFSSAFYS